MKQRFSVDQVVRILAPAGGPERVAGRRGVRGWPGGVTGGAAPCAPQPRSKAGLGLPRLFTRGLLFPVFQKIAVSPDGLVDAKGDHLAQGRRFTRLFLNVFQEQLQIVLQRAQDRDGPHLEIDVARHFLEHDGPPRRLNVVEMILP